MSVDTLERKNEKAYTRRINQVGNSLSLNIPKNVADQFQINKGDEVEVAYDQEKDEVIMKKVSRLPQGVRPEVLGAMSKAITKYDSAIRNLKDR